MLEQPSFETNELIEKLPMHLRQFIKPQVYSDYSPIDQAVWRYVMRKNVAHLSKVAHRSYADGLRKTGISIETIPSMYGMNRILREIGWAAVAVDGFIPPNAFMEFQAYKVLVIAADIRQLEHIEYTPSPDIIHEAAGHAPMIANPDYAEYLRRLGALGAKAIWSHYDGQLYEAIRKLSILKEASGANPAEIADAMEEVEHLQQQKPALSEMAQLRNLQWWTVEYGLIGSLEDPKIYGAGLLSSIGESEWCLKPNVIKVPFSIDAAQVSFDITQPQPQLFVTPDFPFLMDVLEDFANTTGLRTGGSAGLQKLIRSDMTGTIELDNGLQVSGLFSSMITGREQSVIFAETIGQTALSLRDKELTGHGPSTYPTGLSFPLGRINSIRVNGELRNGDEIHHLHLAYETQLTLEYEQGIKAEGQFVMGFRHTNGKLLFLELRNAIISSDTHPTVCRKHPTILLPMANKIQSAFAGAADPTSFPSLYSLPQTQTPHPPKTKERKDLEQLYQQVRLMRETGLVKKDQLREIISDLLSRYSDDWLLSCELLEITTDVELRDLLADHLMKLKTRSGELETLISDGIEMAYKKILIQ